MKPSSSPRFSFGKYFAHGESLVAMTGMGFIAILTLVVGGVVWVSARAVDDSASIQAEHRVKEATSLLAAQAELRSSDQDLSGLRRLMLDAVASSLVETARVRLPGVGIIASSESGETTVDSFPEEWSSSVATPSSIVYSESTNRVLVSEPLQVDGHNGLVLELEVDQSERVAGADMIRASSVGIVSVGLVLTLLVYRRFRNRIGALAAIAESLSCVSEGERRVDCLLVGENLGSEAVAWNTMLREREEIERASSEQEINEVSIAGAVDSFGLPGACNTLTQGIVVAEQDMSVIYANGAAAVFLRSVRDELLGLKLDELDGFDELIQAVREIFSDPNAKRRKIEIGDAEHLEDGGAVLRVQVSRAQDEGVVRAVIFIEDITQQRLASQSQNAFIAQATHELRTPLTTIRLYCEEAVEAGSEDEQIREKALNVISSETRRLERIVGDMLSVSEIEAGSMTIRREPMRTEQLFEELREDYRAQADEKSIELVFDLPPKFPTIQADRDRLGQAIHNLLGNAIKYTPSGGKVEVSASFDERDAMTVSVSDNGIGIDESQQERIFERFCRAEDRRIAQVTGSGLGLALARQVARLHGGDISVESDIDQGSKFTLFIPGVVESAKAA